MQDASSKQTNKKIQAQPSADRITTSLSLAHQRKNKQTNKNSAQFSPYMKLTQTTGPTLGGQKPKGKKNSTLFKERIQLSSKPGKRDLKHNNFKKKMMKRQRNTTQMKEQTRNTEVQTYEEEIGKLPEKEFRIIIVKMIKNLQNKMEKTQESINKDLEELNNSIQ